MGRQATDGGAEACALLLNIYSLHVVDTRDTRGVALKKATEVRDILQTLLSSRALTVLVEFFARFLGAEGNSDAKIRQLLHNLSIFSVKPCYRDHDLSAVSSCVCLIFYLAYGQ